MLRTLFVISLHLHAIRSSRPFRGSAGIPNQTDFVTSPCGGQSIEDIMTNSLLCDGSSFIPPPGISSGYYYYETGMIVDRPIMSYKQFHFEYQVDPDTQLGVLSTREDFDIWIDPFHVPIDVVKSNGGICIPFGPKVEQDDG